jgi:hypothetical protein
MIETRNTSQPLSLPSVRGETKAAQQKGVGQLSPIKMAQRQPRPREIDLRLQEGARKMLLVAGAPYPATVLQSKVCSHKREQGNGAIPLLMSAITKTRQRQTGSSDERL